MHTKLITRDEYDAAPNPKPNVMASVTDNDGTRHLLVLDQPDYVYSVVLGDPVAGVLFSTTDETRAKEYAATTGGVLTRTPIWQDHRTSEETP